MLRILLVLYGAGLLAGGYLLMGRLSAFLRRNNNPEEKAPVKRKEKIKIYSSKEPHPWYNTNDNP